MRSIITSIGMALLVLASFSSCKKDNNTPTPPTPVALDSIAEKDPGLQSGLNANINANIQGFYSAVPANYSKTTKNYPLIIFIPGGGQYGNGKTDLPLLLNDGMAELFSVGQFPPNFHLGSFDFSFIVLTPQFKNFPTVKEVEDFLQYAYKNYRIDKKRVYMSGLSVGGIVCGDFAAAYPDQIAAIVPLAGETQSTASAKVLATSNIPVWDFHNNDDPQLSILEALNFVENIKKYNPPIAPKLTIVSARSHDAWTLAIDPTYKEDGKNVYEWMLQYSKP